MSNSHFKSFAYTFDPLQCTRLTNDKYDNIEALTSTTDTYWMHFQKPSKNLKQFLIKKLEIPKALRNVLFEDESRPRFIKHHESIVFVAQGIDVVNMDMVDEMPSLRFWFSGNKLVSYATGELKAVNDFLDDLPSIQNLSPMAIFINLLEYVIYYFDECSYKLDERLDKIETEISTEVTGQEITTITDVRQQVLSLRRYIFPQRDAIILLSNKLSGTSENQIAMLKDMGDNMIRQTETLEMLRERAIILQDNLTNQIGEISNRRMYVLTVIMLIFTPAFFLMSLFSMYLPIPGMNSPWTWWLILAVILLSSTWMLKFFKKRKWL